MLHILPSGAFNPKITNVIGNGVALDIPELKKEIDEILEEEKVEKEIERATMEATRADNLIKHGNEIKARKKRTWFQSEKEKKTTRMKDLASKKAKNNM